MTKKPADYKIDCLDKQAISEGRRIVTGLGAGDYDSPIATIIVWFANHCASGLLEAIG
jgi:hypothetical protein